MISFNQFILQQKKKTFFFKLKKRNIVGERNEIKELIVGSVYITKGTLFSKNETKHKKTILLTLKLTHWNNRILSHVKKIIKTASAQTLLNHYDNDSMDSK